ncbi:triose-phosphate isomerase [uncultured Robinsoniella sp.]|uniref:triose-phosphate isomerase n=1 Tax=uncultured Robinsoniella sp. TaxID=904190 RepID=UPI00374F9D5B
MINQAELEKIIRETIRRYQKKRLIVAVNWKMNMTIAEGRKFLEELRDIPDVPLVIFPPFTTLAGLAEEFTKRNILTGAQNFHDQLGGAFTGEISIPMLQELGCTYLMAGHSERRVYNYESDEEINRKVLAAAKASMKIMLCIGESQKERQEGIWKETLRNQLLKDLERLPKEAVSKVHIAYEPVWAIGTGVSASSDEIHETHVYLKGVIREILGVEVPTLYGGSVNEKNAAAIGKIPSVDGFLIGSAGIHAEKLNYIQECV